MPRQPTTEEALERIHAIRSAPGKFDLKRDLAPFLKHKSNHVIASAAKLAKQSEAAELVPELVDAFLKLFPNAAKRDQGCKALIAIAEALVTMGEEASPVYLAGVHHVQMEGSFGPPIDVAAPLRGICARGLVRTRHRDALFETLNVLTDCEVAARAGAAAALGDANSEPAELLLRMKVLTGDPEVDVLAECFQSLLSISPGRSVEFVARYLRAEDEDTMQAAALALGESRLPGALPILLRAWDGAAVAPAKRTILLSIAMLRNPEAVEFLIERLREEREAIAEYVLEALEMYRGDEAVRSRVVEVVESRKLVAPRWR